MNVMIPLADGFEEIEAVTVVDVLRRAEVQVRCVAIGEDLRVRGSRGLVVLADAFWSAAEAAGCDALILPGGGPGTEVLRRDARVLAAVCDRMQRNRWIGAICAAPQVLQDAGMLKGRRVTCYPSCREGVSDARWEDAPVVVDGSLVTSQGPGSAMTFALTWVELLCGDDMRRAVATGLLVS